MKVAFFAAALLTMSTTALQLNSQYAAAEQTDDMLAEISNNFDSPTFQDAIEDFAEVDSDIDSDNEAECEQADGNNVTRIHAKGKCGGEVNIEMPMAEKKKITYNSPTLEVVDAGFNGSASQVPMDAPKKPMDAPMKPMDAPKKPMDAPKKDMNGAPKKPVDAAPPKPMDAPKKEMSDMEAAKKKPISANSAKDFSDSSSGSSSDSDGPAKEKPAAKPAGAAAGAKTNGGPGSMA